MSLSPGWVLTKGGELACVCVHARERVCVLVGGWVRVWVRVRVYADNASDAPLLVLLLAVLKAWTGGGSGPGRAGRGGSGVGAGPGRAFKSHRPGGRPAEQQPRDSTPLLCSSHPEEAPRALRPLTAREAPP